MGIGQNMNYSQALKVEQVEEEDVFENEDEGKEDFQVVGRHEIREVRSRVALIVVPRWEKDLTQLMKVIYAIYGEVRSMSVGTNTQGQGEKF
jgi:hypothetical protein